MIDQEIINKVSETKLKIAKDAATDDEIKKRWEKALAMYPVIASGQLGAFKVYPKMGRLLIPSSDGKSEYYARVWSGGIICSCPDFRHATQGGPCKHIMVLCELMFSYEVSLKSIRDSRC